jgi:hypothetical protein
MQHFLTPYVFVKFMDYLKADCPQYTDPLIQRIFLFWINLPYFFTDKEGFDGKNIGKLV